MKIEIKVYQQMPYFAEIPYWIWGEVNYDSMGDCHTPTDTQWKFIEIKNRENGVRVSIYREKNQLTIEAVEHTIEKGVAELIKYVNGCQIDETYYQKHIERTRRIRKEFPDQQLSSFDHHQFWGAWKWVGWFATDMTWVGRWIMNSILTKDVRAVNLCVEWLSQDAITTIQEWAFIKTINSLLSRTFKNKIDVLKWWQTSGKTEYPEPDYNRWLEDLKEENKNWKGSYEQFDR